MAADYHRLLQGPLRYLSVDDAIMAPEKYAGRIHNMRLTDEGTWRTVVGPAELRPRDYTNNGGTLPTGVNYNAPHNGVFHCLLEGGLRDVLLVHFDGGIHVLNGWNKYFETIVGVPLAKTPSQNAPLLEDAEYGFLTQFVATPTGVVIVPQGDRAYFYDGTVCEPLGFEEVPGAPTLTGPRSWFEDGGAGVRNDLPNTGGYNHTGLDMADVFGYSRIGSIRNDVIDTTSGKKSNALGGVLQEGEWRGAVQLKDRWGNLSPMGRLSNSVIYEKQDNLTKDRRRDNDETSKVLKGQLLWSSIDTGPSHTWERDLYRTQDMKASGDPSVYWVPPSATVGTSVSSTLPDTATTVYPDNVPDSWLLLKGKDYVPVPRFRIAALAFGRLWIANFDESPGAMRYSEVGFWGTFPAIPALLPDPNGGEITGMHAVAGGLLVFTRSSTFLVQQMGELSGELGFVSKTLHPMVGCESPDTIKTLPSGLTVWLGQEGWYGWAGEGPPSLISSPVRHEVVRRINRARTKRACAAVDPRTGEYRCWVPVDGSTTNNLCVVFDGAGWRTRDDVDAYAVCTTRDHRMYMVALGAADGVKGLWVLDHEAETLAAPGESTAVIETAWLRGPRAHRRGTPRRLQLYLRETRNAKVTVEVMRDWREHPALPGQDENNDLYAVDDAPPFWDTATYGATVVSELREGTSAEPINSHLTRRRPYLSKYDIHVPSCETFKIRLSSDGDFEFVGLFYEEDVIHKGNANMPGGQ